MKKILIITQKVDMNDSSFGFFHDWLREFSKIAQVTVLALEVGEYDLLGVKVFSLDWGGRNRIALNRIARVAFRAFRPFLRGTSTVRDPPNA